MLEDVPSVTAMVVAFSRGFMGASVRNERDPHAEALLPTPFAETLRVLRGAVRGRPMLERAISLATVDTLAHTSLRTEEIDEAVARAVADGTRQLVIVGAGLDARAYRLESLRGVTVYEVDHPATQRLKKSKASRLEPVAEAIIHVAVDFARDRLEDALQTAGHDPAQKTLWIWEGVTMYLPREAMRQTLYVLSRRSAAGSRLVVTYAEPAFTTLPTRLVPAMRAVFAAVGEPIIGDLEPNEMHAELRHEGFEVLSDTGSVEWERRYARSEAPLVRVLERVCVAEKR